MLSSIGNIPQIASTNIPVKVQNKVMMLPQKGSLVNLKVMDKIQGSYKLLINGSIFQSKLPIDAKIGEQFVGKVLSQQPLVIGLDKLVPQINNNPAFLTALMANFGLSDTEVNKNLVNRLIGMDKPLSKSKIERLAEYLALSGSDIDELQMSLLIQVFWSFNDEKVSKHKEEYDLVSKESILDIIKRIKEIVSQVYKRGKSELTRIFEETIVQTSDNFNSGFLPAENYKILNLLSYLNLNYSNSFEMQQLKDELVKFLVQKATYYEFNFYPDFILSHFSNQTFLHFVTYERITAADGTLGLKVKISLNFDTSEEIGFSGLLVNDRFNCDFFFKHENRKLVNGFKWIEDKLIDIGLVPLVGFSKNQRLLEKDGMIIGKTKSINRKI